MIYILCSMLYFTGLWFIIQPLAKQNTNSKVKKAILSRGERSLTSSEKIINSFALLLEKYISIDEIRREKINRDLKMLGETDTPEMFYSKVIAKSLLCCIAAAPIIIFSPFLAVILIISIFIAVYTSTTKDITRRTAEKRTLIERELPQFAGTIKQNLSSTRDIITILEGYRKVCGVSLQNEIDITLTDIKTGSTEKALSNFDARLNSVKVSELVRGLIGVYRGDNQELYFEMLTNNYLKSESEAIKKELLTRPEKLKPNIVMLLICMMFMFIAAIGGYMATQFGTMF